MIAHGNRPATAIAPDAAASTASHPNVRDDGQRPSERRDGRVVEVIWGSSEAEYFCETGLDRANQLEVVAENHTTDSA
jgi:hypothetical protein